MLPVHISNSRIAPGIQIQHRDNVELQKVETALSQIRHDGKGAGQSLLNALRSYTGNGRQLTISVTSADSAAYPKLTQRQIEKHEVSSSPLSQDHNQMGVKLANKRGFLRNGEGTGALVEWNPTLSLDINAEGRPMRGSNPDEAFTSLAHELVHGYRMMKGTATSGGDRYTSGTPSASEEERAVGIGKFRHKAFSENAVRAEHNMPLRQHYAAVEPVREGDEYDAEISFTRRESWD